MAMMPHLVRWHEEYADYGLIILAVHQQAATEDELRERCKALGIRFTVTAGGNIPDSKSNGIPHCALFLPSGECVYDGHPKDVERHLRLAVGATLASKITKLTKAMEPVVESLKKGAAPMDVLKKLNSLKGGDKATSNQAKDLFDRIAEGGRKRLEATRAEIKDDPVAAYESALFLAAHWKGYETGTKAQEIVAKLKLDKNVSAELKARPSLDVIRKMDASLLKAAVGVEITDADFKKKYATQLKEMRKVYETMKRQYPEARSTKQASEIVGKYELTK